MKKILILGTGGTIASVKSPKGLVPGIDTESMMQYLGPMPEGYSIECRDILKLDSSNIQPEEWILIARTIFSEAKNFDGIVLTHGTDTMSYSASVLTFMLQNLPIPVVLTGSQLPLLHPLSDASDNLRCALAIAASETAGVFLAFNRRVMLGCRSVKVRAAAFDAFESINHEYIAHLDTSGLFIKKNLIPKASGEFKLLDSLCSDVFLIKLTPGFNPKIFEMLYKSNYKGIVIEAFGSGGMHYINRDLISELQKLSDASIPVVICSQCLYDPSDLSVYESGRMALKNGAISGRDMTSTAAFTKLMWALGQTNDLAEVKKIFKTNYFNEIKLIEENEILV